MNLSETRVYSGTSGLVIPIRQAEFPEEYRGKSRLEYYASLFNSLEVNSSFYKIPQPSTVEKWANIVPLHFRFTFKLFKEITHVKNFEYKVSDLDVFMQTIAKAHTRQGCLLIQFPPSFKIEKLKELKEFIKKLNGVNIDPVWKTAIEFRSASWYNEEIYDLLNQHNICTVIHDMPAGATTLSISTADFAYLRFHGPGGKYNGSYPDDFLSQYAQYIKEWIKEGKDVYFYFNNTMGDAVRNLQTLNSFLKT